MYLYSSTFSGPFLLLSLLSARVSLLSLDLLLFLSLLMYLHFPWSFSPPFPGPVTSPFPARELYFYFLCSCTSTCNFPCSVTSPFPALCSCTSTCTLPCSVTSPFPALCSCTSTCTLPCSVTSPFPALCSCSSTFPCSLLVYLYFSLLSASVPLLFPGPVTSPFPALCSVYLYFLWSCYFSLPWSSARLPLLSQVLLLLLSLLYARVPLLFPALCLSTSTFPCSLLVYLYFSLLSARVSLHVYFPLSFTSPFPAPVSLWSLILLVNPLPFPALC
jgi:hypothetical protein